MYEWITGRLASLGNDGEEYAELDVYSQFIVRTDDIIVPNIRFYRLGAAMPAALNRTFLFHCDQRYLIEDNKKIVAIEMTFY